jgi:hypothetical protein
MTRADTSCHLSQADADKDGFLSMKEYEGLFTAFAKVLGNDKLAEDSDEMLKTYKAHDLNKDGKLTSQVEEWRIGHTKCTCT